jgi:hypothetical protein
MMLTKSSNLSHTMVVVVQCHSGNGDVVLGSVAAYSLRFSSSLRLRRWIPASRVVVDVDLWPRWGARVHRHRHGVSNHYKHGQ